MDGEKRTNECATPHVTGHSQQNDEQQKRFRRMEQHVSKMMAAGLRPP